MKTYNLYRWSVQARHGGPYSAPESLKLCLVGWRDHEAEVITTSAVEAADGRIITTHTGNKYILQDMDPAYREFLDKNNIPFDTNNPILLKKK